jgi:DNA mismatch repair protein MutL
MTIQILPARLANQIAAGEVVERPASVVKELVENSLDAGATRIEIEIDKGGMQRIQLRDNGCGIPKEELTLALSRHATSKISSLDDLEAIVSLGFRGEALASISSVSRLTLTSRTADQTEAWSAYAEGREMTVTIKPASHPVGTTLVALDLFFNTPARRKFLRSEKTEFSHIDEVLKRIALSRFDVSITLKHNGKLVRQYRPASELVQKERRLSAVCGQGFVNEALAVSLDHFDLRLSGWIGTPLAARAQTDLQYCYVNGRIMRDKVINHAIRQAYQQRLPNDKYAAYVLFIEIDPHQIDVNVHPAKHEVRFHQGRLVHDFILQALQTALQEGLSLPPVGELYDGRINNESESSLSFSDKSNTVEVQNTSLINQSGTRQLEINSTPPKWGDNTPNYPNAVAMSEWEKTSIPLPLLPDQAKNNTNLKPLSVDIPSHLDEISAYQALTKSTEIQTHTNVNDPVKRSKISEKTKIPNRNENAVIMPLLTLGKPLTVLDGQFVLLQNDAILSLFSMSAGKKLLIEYQLKQALKGEALSSQPLLIPHRIPVSLAQQQSAMAQIDRLRTLGVTFKLQGKTHLTVLTVSTLLRQQNMQHFLPYLIDWCTQSIDDLAFTDLAQHLLDKETDHSLASAIRLLNDLEQAWGRDLPHYYPILLRPLPVQSTIDSFLL